jgi:hypothetical protein
VRLAALAAVGVSLVLAAPALADVRNAHLGDVSAALTLTHHDGYDSGLRLVVTKAGTTVWSGAITTREGRPGAPATPRVRDFVDVELRVLDLDGDGTGEAVIDLAERGAYCCSHTTIIGAQADGTFAPLELDWGSYASAPVVTPIATGDLLVARDARLDERYTPHVLSFMPVRIWRYDHGTLQDASHDQPAVVQGDLSQLLHERAQLLHRSDHRTIDLRGLLTAIAGDRLLLGQQPQAVASLNADVAAGNVRVSSGGGPLGAKFPPALLKLLARLHY